MADTLFELISGAMGGGKTYYSVQRICSILGAGGKVWTNVECSYPAIRDYLAREENVSLPRENLIYLRDLSDADSLDELPSPDMSILDLPGGLFDFLAHLEAGNDDIKNALVLDEIHLWLDSADHKKQSQDAQVQRLMRFITQVRKSDVHVYLISQDIMNINVRLRRMAHFNHYCLNLRNMRLLGIPIRVPILLRVQRDARTDTVVRRSFERLRSAIFSLYSSKAVFRGLRLPTSDTAPLARARPPSPWPRRIHWAATAALAAALSWTWLAPDPPPIVMASALSPSPPVRPSPPAQPVAHPEPESEPEPEPESQPEPEPDSDTDVTGYVSRGQSWRVRVGADWYYDGHPEVRRRTATHVHLADGRRIPLPFPLPLRP